MDSTSALEIPSGESLRIQRELRHLHNSVSRPNFDLTICDPVSVFRFMAEWRSTLVGRICYDDTIRSNFRLYMAFKTVWEIPYDLHITACGHNRFLFKFRYQFDMSRILHGGPWSIFGFMVVLKPWNQFIRPRDMLLEREPFWVRMLNVPTIHINEDSLWHLASQAGLVMCIDPASINGIRVRVMVAVSSQLKRGAHTPVIGGVRSWVGFQYEKLPFQFCKLCYFLGHTMTACPTLDQTRFDDTLYELDDYNYVSPFVAHPMDVGGRNHLDEDINPYGDESSDSEDSETESSPTLDIILNSTPSQSESSPTLGSPNIPEFICLEHDPCRIIMNRPIIVNHQLELSQIEDGRSRCGKRPRTEDNLYPNLGDMTKPNVDGKINQLDGHPITLMELACSSSSSNAFFVAVKPPCKEMERASLDGCVKPMELNNIAGEIDADHPPGQVSPQTSLAF